MPCILKTRIVSASGLPTNYASIAVELKLDPHHPSLHTSFTTINGATNHFEWNDDFRFEISDDSVVQDNPLECCVVGRETVVGVVFIDLNPLLVETGTGQLSGSFAIVNISMGIQGQLHLQAKLEAFGDRNPWKYSSAGIEIFSMQQAPKGSILPDGRSILSILGLVDSMILVPHIADKPSTHQTSDYGRLLPAIRYSPAYGQERQYFHITGELRRLIGLRAQEMHANAVLGLQCFFDFYRLPNGGQSMIMARGLGVGFKMNTVSDDRSQIATPEQSEEDDQDRGKSLFHQTHVIPPSIPLLTIMNMPEGTLRSIGGIVSSKNVKLLSKSRTQMIDVQSTDEFALKQEWFDEVRQEIREHARLLRCNVVYGYTEQVAIYDDLYITMAHGTAARCDFSQTFHQQMVLKSVDTEDENDDENSDRFFDSKILRQHQRRQHRREKRRAIYKKRQGCYACHLPYRRARSPFPTAFSWCRLCQRRHVPEVIFSTASVPVELARLDQVNLIESYVCRPLMATDNPSGIPSTNKGQLPSSTAAVLISTALPFVEYELHRQLLYRLRLVGANSLWSLKYRLIIQNSCLIAIAFGSALCMTALPCPEPLKCIRTLNLPRDHKALVIEQSLEAISLENQERCKTLLLEHCPQYDDHGNNRQAITSNSSSSSSSDDSDSSASTSSTSDESTSKSSSSSSSSSNTIDPLSFVQIDDETDLDLLYILQCVPKIVFNGIEVSMSTNDGIDIQLPFTIPHTIFYLKSIPIGAIESGVYLANCISLIRNEAIEEHLTNHVQVTHMHLSCIDYQLVIAPFDHLILQFSAICYCTCEKNDIKLEDMLIVTPSTFLPNSSLLDHKGHVALHTVREVSSSTYHSSYQAIINELLTSIRSQIMALGGNTLTSAYLDYVHHGNNWNWNHGYYDKNSHNGYITMEMSISGDVQLLEFHDLKQE